MAEEIKYSCQRLPVPLKLIGHSQGLGNCLRLNGTSDPQGKTNSYDVVAALTKSARVEPRESALVTARCSALATLTHLDFVEPRHAVFTIGVLFHSGLRSLVLA